MVEKCLQTVYLVIFCVNGVIFVINNGWRLNKMKLIKTVDAEGTVLCHDITQIIKALSYKGRSVP